MKAKALYAIVIILTISFAGFTPDKQLHTIESALKDGNISCTYKVNTESPHYVRPILLTVKNRKNTALAVKIEPGQQFHPDDENYQNLIVTRESTIALRPNEQKTVEVYAMCTEAGDKAPSDEIAYKLAPLAQGNLKKTAEYISKSGSFNITGQQAMWAVSSNRDIEEIMGPDTAETRSLQRFIAKLTGKKIPVQNSAANYATNYYAPPKPEVSYYGNFGMKISKPAALTIALFNENNVVQRELYANPAVPKGDHTFKYAFDNSVYTDEYYTIKIIVDGDIKFKRRIKMSVD